MVWDVNKGTPLTALVLHQPILGLAMASDASRIGVQLLDSRSMLIVFLHNTPASYVTLPAYVAPKEMEGKRRRSAQRPLGDASAARSGAHPARRARVPVVAVGWPISRADEPSHSLRG